MNTDDYKQKYLKYKQKYLQLKELEKSCTSNTTNLSVQQQQMGGFAYAPGEYVFFIPSNKSDFDKDKATEFMQKQLVDAGGNILGMNGLNDLTNYLGNCTKYLRVGTTSTGYDFANTYNTLYSNQSSSDVIKRETNDAWVATKPYIDSAAKTTEEIANKTLNAAKEIVAKTSDAAKEMYEQVVDKGAKAAKDAKGGEGGEGGEGCNKIPIKLPTDLLIKQQNDINEDKLTKIIKFINEKKLQGSMDENKIERIIFVKKPIIPGKPSTIDTLRNFVVKYDANGNDFTITKKLKIDKD